MAEVKEKDIGKKKRGFFLSARAVKALIVLLLCLFCVVVFGAISMYQDGRQACESDPLGTWYHWPHDYDDRCRIYYGLVILPGLMCLGGLVLTTPVWMIYLALKSMACRRGLFTPEPWTEGMFRNLTAGPAMAYGLLIEAAQRIEDFVLKQVGH